MTLLNFPPTNGQPTDGSFTYTANGVIYSWDGEKWTANSEQGLDGNYVNKDGDTMTGDLTVPSLNGGPLAGFRNQIINGDFNIAQRGTNFSGYTDSNEYTLDRWHINTTSTRIQQDSGGPLGFAKHVIMYQVGTPAGSTKQQITQQIELPAPGRAGAFVNGSTWTISYWARLNGAPSTNNPFSVIVKYTRGSGITSSVNVDFLNASQAFTTDWVRYSHTFTITKDPEADDTCMGVFFICNPGVNVAVRLTGVQLEPGSQPTPFEMRPFGTELALCQRYYNVFRGINYFYSLRPGGDDGRGIDLTFPSTMRTLPTIAWSGSSNLNNLNQSLLSNRSLQLSAAGVTNTASGWLVDIEADAEL